MVTFDVNRILGVRQDVSPLRYEGGWLLTSPSELKKSSVGLPHELIIGDLNDADENLAQHERRGRYGTTPGDRYYVLQKRT